ncbi:UNVERIFIED_CONTAM: hypothetical protein ITI05_24690 [Salmonella enterica subsp. enterica serovar Weltevreden]
MELRDPKTGFFMTNGSKLKFYTTGDRVDASRELTKLGEIVPPGNEDENDENKD